MIGVGLIEEARKLGVAAGAGFAAMATMGYAFTTLVTSRAAYRQRRRTPAARPTQPGRTHGVDRDHRGRPLPADASGWRGRKVAQAGFAFLVAVALHALWDSQKSLLGTVVS